MDTVCDEPSRYKKRYNDIVNTLKKRKLGYFGQIMLNSIVQTYAIDYREKNRRRKKIRTTS